jgi:hypothetical protein
MGVSIEVQKVQLAIESIFHFSIKSPRRVVSSLLLSAQRARDWLCALSTILLLHQQHYHPLQSIDHRLFADRKEYSAAPNPLTEYDGRNSPNF